MPTESHLQAISKIKRIHENVMIVIGITIGITLLLYFVTFAMLIDRGSALFTFQVVSSLVLVAILIYIRRFSFTICRILLGHKAPYSILIKHLSHSDMSMDEKALAKKLEHL